MIDTIELRKLTQAATSGEWYVKRGNYIYGRNEVTDGEEVWYPVIACTDDDEVNVNFEANAAFIAAANPAAISELLDRLEAAEKDVAIKEEVIDSLAAVVKRLDAQCDAAEKERDALLEACETFAEWLGREESGFARAGNKRDTPEGERAWRDWYNENLRLCALAQEQARAAIAKTTGEQP